MQSFESKQADLRDCSLLKEANAVVSAGRDKVSRLSLIFHTVVALT